MKTRLFITAMFILISFGFAQSQNYWISSNSSAKGKPILNKLVDVSYFEVYTLDYASFNAALQNAPMRGENSKASELLLTFPNAEGQLITYSVVEAPVMHPDLAVKYPGIKSYAGQAVNAPASIRFSVSYQRGLYGMIFNEDEGNSFIDPYSQDFTEYMVYSKSDMIRTSDDDFICTMPDEHDHSSETGGMKATNDKKLRKYRLALCCNAEYGNLFIGSATTDAQKRANILAQMNITMTRVNGVYEKDLAITMEIIPNNDVILWYGSTTADPWSGEFNTMTAQTIDSYIGVNNYDIGHNFNTSGGGNAGCIACVCLAVSQSGTHKGRGMTGRSDPTGDAFDIDYVAHEMGHQFGGYHTMNTCSRSGSGSTEVEPTSGSTIMGYAGICSYNIQSNSDDYFAYVNIRDISANVQSGNSSSCAQVITITNNPPTANAGSDYTIPKSTAFVLTGTGSDPDGNPITYTWEQNDPAQAPAATAPVSTWTVGPLFRSIKGTTSPLRYFPNINSIIANNLTPAYEVVPSVGRTLNFSLVVRDNVIGGGQTANDLMVVTVNGTAGPFTVSAPNTAVSWASGSTQTVTWNVSGTTAAPVSCANVDILLSTDGGYTYPITILTNTPNDGTQTITVPNNPSTTCRMMVKGSGNIFFDISNVNFTITGSTNTIASGTVSGSPFCSGVAVNVPFTMSGTFNPGNVFTAQLSDAAGSFASPVAIGTLTGTTSGTISGTIPLATPSGTGYRIRVVSSSPVTIGTDNGVNITVNATSVPSVSISASSSSICVGTSVTFTATPTNGGTPTYQWKLNGANVGTNSPTYTNGSLANGNTVTCVMTSTALCASPTTANANTITMVVNAVPSTPSPTSSSPVCVGGNINLTTATVSGATYSWTGPNSFTSTSQNPTLSNATTLMAGTYNVLVIQGGCQSLPGSTTVVVNSGPATPGASSNGPVCLASSINLTTPTVVGATYSWSGPNGFTSTQQNPVISNATSAMAGTYSVIITQGACPSLPGTTTLAIDLPPVTSFSGTPTSTMCSGFVQFTDNSTGSPSSWLWDFGDGQTSTLQNPSHDYLAGGTYTITLNVSNSCGNNQLINTNYVTINVPNAPVATGASRCGTGTVALSATGSGILHWFDAATGGTDLITGTTYTTPSISSTTTYYVENHLVQASQYVGNTASTSNGSTFTATNEHYLIFTSSTPFKLVSVEVNATTAGNRVIQLRDASGTTLQTTTVNIPAGVSRVTLNFDVPVGTNLRLVGPGSPNLWRSNAGVAYPYNIPGIVSITNSDAGTVYYYYFYNWEIKEPDCVSSRVPVVATINTALPASVSISPSSSTICSGTNVSFTATPSNGGTTPAYQWQVNGVNTGSNSSTFTSTGLANNDIVSCIMTSNGTCVSGSPANSNTVTMTVNPLLTPAVAVSATATTICSGTSVTFTATPTNGGTPSYQWKLNGANVGTNSPTYTNGALANGNTVQCVMTSTVTCPTTPTVNSNTVTMTVNPLLTPAVAVSASATTICSGTSVTFTATPTNGGTPSYQWKLNGANVGTNSPTYTNGALANGNTVQCVMTSTVTCPTTPTVNSNTVTMTVNPLLTPAVAVSASATTICSGTSVTFTATPTNGGTPSYQWKLNGANVGTNSPTYSNASLINNDIVSCLMTSTASCLTTSTVNSNNITMSVNTLLTPAVSISASATNICDGNPVTFTAAPVNGGTPTYQWLLNGSNVGTNSATYTNGTLANSDIVSCIMTSSISCASSPTVNSNNITINVNSSLTPSVSIVGPTTICSGTSALFVAAPVNGGVPSYQWQINGLSVGTNSDTYSSNTFSNADVVSCVMTTTVTCSTSPTATSNNVIITVNPLVTPLVNISATATSICEGTSVSFSATPTFGGTPSYQWLLNGVNVGTDSDTYLNSTLSDADIVSCVMTSTELCSTSPTAASNNVIMTVNPIVIPIVDIIASETSICTGTTVTFTANPTNGGTPSYQWQLNGVNTGTNSATYVNGTLANNDVVSCIMTTTENCSTVPTTTSNSITMNVNIPVSPLIVIAASSTTICSGQSVTFNATSLNGGSPVYQWTINGVGVGNNSSTYTTSTLNDADVVACIMTSDAPCVYPAIATSNEVVMTVSQTVVPTVAVSADPSVSVCPNTPITFTANETNGGSPSFVWTINGLFAGTNNTLTGNFTNGQVIICTMTSDVTCASSATVSSIPLIVEVYNVASVLIIENSNILSSDALTGNQWFEQSAGILVGEVGQEFIPSSDGLYYSVVTDINGCTSVSNVINFIYSSIGNPNLNNTILVYPNPSHGLVNISFEKEMKDVQIEIENVIGEIVYQGIYDQSSSSVKTVDLTNYAKGLYFVNIRNQNSDLRYKLILEK